MKTLSTEEKLAFRQCHLKHRLTLLRTLRVRKNQGETFAGCGDVYRCVKDSNLIGVRLLMDFLGLRDGDENGRLTLRQNPRKPGLKFADDVKLDQFFGRLLQPNDVPHDKHELLAGVYRR